MSWRVRFNHVQVNEDLRLLITELKCVGEQIYYYLLQSGFVSINRLEHFNALLTADRSHELHLLVLGNMGDNLYRPVYDGVQAKEFLVQFEFVVFRLRQVKQIAH